MAAGSRDLDGVLDRYGSGPSGRAGSTDRTGSSGVIGRTDSSEGTGGGLRSAPGPRVVRPSDRVRTQPGGGYGSGTRTGSGGTLGGGSGSYGSGSSVSGSGVSGGRGRGAGPSSIRSSVAGGYTSGNAGGSIRAGADRSGGVIRPTSSYGSGVRASGVGSIRATGTRGSVRGTYSYDDPRFPRGTASWSPWGYFHRDRGVSFHFGYHCGSSYWYWNWPAYYCWYLPYRYHYWYYPVVYAPSTRTEVIYVDNNDPDIVYVEGAGEAVIVDGAPAGRVAAPGGAEGAVPGEDPNAAQGLDELQEENAPEPLSLAAERYLSLGDQAFRDGRYADAVHFYARSIEFAPKNGVLFLVLSDALFATGDYHYAAYAIRKALDLDPALIAATVDKHFFYDDPAEFDRQLALLENFVGDHPGNVDARLVLAVNLLFGNRPADAVDLLAGAQSEREDSKAEDLVLEQARALQFGPK